MIKIGNLESTNNENREYELYIQKLDIKTLIENGIKVPTKLKELYDKGFLEEELKEYVYIKDEEVSNFIASIDYIRRVDEFIGLNDYELELLIKYYSKNIKEMKEILENLQDEEDKKAYKVILNFKINELVGIKLLKEEINNKTRK